MKFKKAKEKDVQLAFMLDIGLKVLNKLKEMPFRKNYLNFFSVVLSP